MKVTDFDYDLPPHYIAQVPVEPRDASRLMILNRHNGQVEHRIFRDIVAYLHPNDVLVLNDTRVIPARLQAYKADTGGAVELLLLRKLDAMRWHALIGGRRVSTNTELRFSGTSVTARVSETLDNAERVIVFSQPIESYLTQIGETPLPPYIHEKLDDAERYQTVYSRQQGSAAAPTAGLHFTGDLLVQIRQMGVQIAYCTLHIGLDTFAPVRVEQVEDHHIHTERAVLTPENARLINEAKLAGGRIIAVGTTSARTLETAGILSAGGDPSKPFDDPQTCPWRPVVAFERDTELFIFPGYRWRVVDALLTNFHLPRSTLLMMISSFADREHVLNAYEIAKQENYRFFSFGDAMFIR
jgi:S-adenosylmethionine:tRNA ribosyltransferase-isomerase